MVLADVPPERGYVRQNHPFTKPPFYLPVIQQVLTLIPLSVLFRFLCLFGVVATLAFFSVQRAFGGSKKRSFDKKSVGRKF